jgi:hypothetical protein
MRRRQLYLLRLREHPVAMPTRLFNCGFWERHVRAKNFIVKLRKVNHIPIEASVILTEVTKEERFLGFFLALLGFADQRLLIFFYLFSFVILFSSEPHFLSPCLVILGRVLSLSFIILSCVLLLFTGISPGAKCILKLPLLFFLVVIAV